MIWFTFLAKQAIILQYLIFPGQLNLKNWLTQQGSIAKNVYKRCNSKHYSNLMKEVPMRGINLLTYAKTARGNGNG